MLRNFFNFRFRLSAAIFAVAVGGTVAGLMYYYEIASRQIWSQMTNRVKDFGKIGITLFNTEDLKFLEKLDLEINSTPTYVPSLNNLAQLPQGAETRFSALSDEEKTQIIRKNQFQYIVQKLRHLRQASGKKPVHDSTLPAAPTGDATQLPQIRRVWIAGIKMHEHAADFLRVLCADEFEEIDRNSNQKIDPWESIYHIGDIFNGRGESGIKAALAGEAGVGQTYRSENTGIYISGYTPVKNAMGATIALLVVDFSAATEFDAIFDLKITGYYIIIGVLLFSILAAATMSRLLLRPLEEMQQAAVRIGQRDFSIRINTQYTDELSDLAYALNLMAHELGEYSTNIERRISARTREISGILGALEQGLLTIDRRGIIQAEHSRATLAIFGIPEIAHRKFSSLFSDEKTQSAIEKYTEIFFTGQNISAQMLERANPVRQIEYRGPSGEIKHLRFHFTPLYAEDEKEISRLLVTIIDDTDEVLLRQKISLADADKKSEFDILINLMQIPPAILESFIAQQREFLQEGKKIISHFETISHDQVRAFATHVHALKGNAAQLGFNILAELLHGLEDHLQEKLEGGKQSDKYLRHELSRVVNEAEGMILGRDKLIARIQALVGKADTDHPMVRLRRLANFWLTLIEQKAAQNDVPIKADVDFEMGGEEAVHAVHNVLVQLLRNTFAHGKEDAETRVSKGKPVELMISLKSKTMPGGTYIDYAEDGKGFPGVKPGDSLSLRDLIQKGLTSANKSASIEAGRGLGMEYIGSFIEKLGGSCTLTYSGNVTEIRMFVPSGHGDPAKVEDRKSA